MNAPTDALTEVEKVKAQLQSMIDELTPDQSPQLLLLISTLHAAAADVYFTTKRLIQAASTKDETGVQSDFNHLRECLINIIAIYELMDTIDREHKKPT